MRRALIILIALNSIIVTSAWWYHHIFLPDDHWLRVGFRLCLFVLVALPAIFWWWRRHTTLTLSLPGVVASLAGATITLFDAQVFLFPALFPGEVSYVSSTGILPATLFFGTTLVAVLIGFFILSLALTAAGELALRFWRPTNDWTLLPPAFRLLFTGALGIFAWTSIILLLNWFGILSTTTLLGVLAFVFLANLRQFFSLLRQALSLRLTLHWQSVGQAALFASLFFLIALALGDTVRPTPVGYDDMTYYLSRVELMKERSHLLPTSWPNIFETIALGISLVTNETNQLFALSFGVYSLILGTLIVFLIGTRFWNSSFGLMASVITLSIPIGPALAIAETKPDSLLFPLLALAFWNVLEYWEKPRPFLLGLGSFLLGLAVTVKLTALFLALPFFMSMLVALVRTSPTFRFSIRSIFLAGCCFGLAWLPWTAHDLHFATQEPSAQSMEPTLLESFEDRLAPLACTYTGAREDFDRFKTQSKRLLPAWWYLPWETTMNTTVRSFATEIGLLFLALIPWLLIVRRRATPNPDADRTSRLSLLAFVSLAALVLWALLGEGVIWYAYPVFLPLTLLVCLALKELRRSHPYAWALAVLILVFGLVGHTLVRMKTSAIDANLRYGTGQADATTYLDTAFPGYAKAMEILNDDPAARIYITGSRFWYGIHDNDRRAFMDSHLDAFHCLIQSLGPVGTAKALRELDIRYILFSRDLVRQMELNDRPTLAVKVREFTEFSAGTLRPVWGSPTHIIFELAPATFVPR